MTPTSNRTGGANRPLAEPAAPDPRPVVAADSSALPNTPLQRTGFAGR